MEPLLGQIQLYAFGFAPSNWLSCDGQILNISTNQALYTLLGTNFGGNGTTTFGLPNLNNAPNNDARPVPQMKYYIATMGIYPSRN